MADKPLSEQERPTWQDKLQQGKPLNPLEEVKADADFNYQQRLREEEARKEFEQLKAGRGAQPAANADSSDESGSDNSNSNDGKKGK